MSITVYHYNWFVLIELFNSKYKHIHDLLNNINNLLGLKYLIKTTTEFTAVARTSMFSSDDNSTKQGSKLVFTMESDARPEIKFLVTWFVFFLLGQGTRSQGDRRNITFDLLSPCSFCQILPITVKVFHYSNSIFIGNKWSLVKHNLIKTTKRLFFEH